MDTYDPQYDIAKLRARIAELERAIESWREEETLWDEREKELREALEDIGDQGGTFGSGKLPSAYDKGCRARKALEGQR